MMAHYIDEANLGRSFFEMADRHASKPLLFDKSAEGWRHQTYAEIAIKVRNLAGHLHQMGIGVSDRVVICGENRSEWAIADLAVLSMGAVSVPAYTTNTVDDHDYIISHSQASLVICTGGMTGQRMYEAVRNQKSHVPFICFDSLEDVQPLSVDDASTEGFIPFSRLVAEQPAEDIIDTALAAQSPDDMCCIIYTSGTGGRPKGVMLTHRSIQSNITAAMELLAEGGATDEARFLSLLPLSHSYEHTAGMYLPFQIGAEVWYCEGADKIAANLEEVGPTVMTAVPRLYEVLHDRITKGVKAKGGLTETLFTQAVRLGRKKLAGESLSVSESLLDRLVDRLVRTKMKKRLGGRLKYFVSGGAALNPDIGHFFLALGVDILQGYGQTEASPLISANRPHKIRIETVGPVVGGVEVKLSDAGELLARGDCIMKGYWRDEKATSETLKQGWLYTGDLAEISDDGYISITGRKKDIIVNSGGDNIAPSRVEAQLTIEPEIEQVMVSGDKRPYLAAVIVPSEDVLKLGETKAQKAAIQAAVTRANERLSQLEKIRKFIIAPEAFTVDNSQMTPTLKVRRHIVGDLYKSQLDGLYR